MEEKEHTVRFEFNKKIERLREILNSINEEEQKFTVEKYLEMIEIAREVYHIFSTISSPVTIRIDDKLIPERLL